VALFERGLKIRGLLYEVHKDGWAPPPLCVPYPPYMDVLLLV
jgi:hypothetical protein